MSLRFGPPYPTKEQIEKNDMTKPTAFEEAEERFVLETHNCLLTHGYEREWFFNAGRQAERDEQDSAVKQDVPPEGTKGE